MIFEKVTYYAQRAFYLSALEPTSFDRQAAINKFLVVFVVVLCIVIWNLGTKFAALEAEIAVRRASSDARVRQWNERIAQDSAQRMMWETLKATEQIKLQTDSMKKKVDKLKNLRIPGERP